MGSIEKHISVPTFVSVPTFGEMYKDCVQRGKKGDYILYKIERTNSFYCNKKVGRTFVIVWSCRREIASESKIRYDLNTGIKSEEYKTVTYNSTGDFIDAIEIYMPEHLDFILVNINLLS